MEENIKVQINKVNKNIKFAQTIKLMLNFISIMGLLGLYGIQVYNNFEFYRELWWLFVLPPVIIVLFVLPIYFYLIIIDFIFKLLMKKNIDRYNNTLLEELKNMNNIDLLAERISFDKEDCKNSDFFDFTITGINSGNNFEVKVNNLKSFCMGELTLYTYRSKSRVATASGIFSKIYIENLNELVIKGYTEKNIKSENIKIRIKFILILVLDIFLGAYMYFNTSFKNFIVSLSFLTLTSIISLNVMKRQIKFRTNKKDEVTINKDDEIYINKKIDRIDEERIKINEIEDMLIEYLKLSKTPIYVSFKKNEMYVFIDGLKILQNNINDNYSIEDFEKKYNAILGIILIVEKIKLRLINNNIKN